MRLSRRTFARTALAGGLWAKISAKPIGASPRSRRPNLVVIMTDNHGAWTLGCYGNPDIKTPHIDRLASKGVLFTRAFSCNAVCSPTRATFLTGLMPSQHGVHCYLRANEAQMGPNAYCTIAEFPTLPKQLTPAGYTCGLVGKWHLGDNLHPQEGFTYWITMPHGHTTAFYDAQVIEDARVRSEPGYLTDLWTNHAIRFLEQTRDKPFFLFLAYNGPYGLGQSLTRPARNRHAEYYADKLLPSFPRRAIHPWLRNNRQYMNNLEAMRRYAAELSGVDDGVGRVMAALERLDLDQSTLVVFLADQGWGGGQHGIWGMGDHTRPLHAFDETMHIPLIFRHPGSIQAGGRCDRMVANYDLMPTLLGYLGMETARDESRRSPGRDFAPILRSETMPWQNEVFYEFEDTRAIRTPDWKYIHRHPSGPNELYDLKTDPGEVTNLIDDAAHIQTRKRLRARLRQFFDRYADPKYDLWRGGRSKVARLVPPSKE